MYYIFITLDVLYLQYYMYLFKLDATDSTNSYLRELSIEKDFEKWAVVTADYQFAGRGQKGAEWHSEKGKNLICSILVKFNNLSAGDQFMINCAVSTGIQHYLERYGLPKLTVKWPNDIMSVSRKLGGILIENNVVGGMITQSIIGIGINVNQEKFPKNLPMAVSVKQLTGIDTARDIFLQDLISAIQNKFEMVFEKRYDELTRLYESRLFRKGKAFMYQNTSGEKFLGIIKGVSNKGELLVEREDESIERFNFKEISYL